MSNAALLEALKAAKAKHMSRAIQNVYQLKEGKTRLRILPGKDGNVVFWQDLGAHWIKNLDGKVEAVAGCHDIIYDTPCPVCAALDKASKAASSDEELAALKEMKAKKAVLVNAVIRNAETADPQIVQLPSTVFTTICTMIGEYAEEVDVLDIKTGIDFIIERTGKGKETKYAVTPALKSEALSPDALKKAASLAQFVKDEYFAKEVKALNALANFGGPTSIPTSTRAALTGPASSIKIIDAEVQIETPAPKPAAASPAAKPVAAAASTADFDAPVSDTEIDDILASLDGV